MRLIRLTITNFRSFKEERTFFFPEGPGLYFMQGVNEVEPKLEANGAGKTTIWDALTWLFFAKTAKGLKAGEVCNWEVGKGTCVELAFDDGDVLTLQVIKRTWGPNSWTLSELFGKVTDLTKDKGENSTLALLKLEFTPFLNTILMAQGQPMFIDLKHDAKAALFSDVMGLDLWLEQSTKASKRASAQDSITRDHERNLASLGGKIETLRGQDITTDIRKWQKDHDFMATGLEKDYKIGLAGRKEALTLLPVLDADLLDCRGELNQALDEQAQLMDASITAVSLTNETLRIFERARAEYKAGVQQEEDMLTGTCPTCGQAVAANHSHQPVNLRSLLKVHDLAKTEHDKALRWENTCVDEKKKQAKNLTDRRDDYDLAERSLSDQKRKIQLLESELDRIEETMEKWVVTKNPYADLQERTRQALVKLEGDRDDTQRLLDDSQSRYSLFSFWVRGFKELRLQLIAEALSELEIEVNSCVTAKGLVDWEIHFAVDRETKGGNVQRGFSVFVKSPHNDLPVPWEAWSGGEAQRLRIATQEGLANLIRSRTGTGLNLEVWDEPCSGLSEQGVRDLLDSLVIRAREEDRQIWIVDHTAHSFGGFAGGATITKTKSGSALTQY
jgi:DNA repair exonuclease SbcCD ATPase subunit